MVERLFLIPKEGTCGRVCEWSYLVSFGAVSFDKHRQTGGYRPTDRQQDFRHPTDQLTLIWPYAPHFSSGWYHMVGQGNWKDIFTQVLKYPFFHGGFWHGIPKNIWFGSFQHQSLPPRTLRKWLWVHRKVCIALVSTALHIFVRVSARLRASACAGSTTGWGSTLGSRSEVRHRVHGRAADPHTEWPSTWHWNYRSPPWPGLDGNTTLAKPVPKLFSLICSSVPWLI